MWWPKTRERIEKVDTVSWNKSLASKKKQDKYEQRWSFGPLENVRMGYFGLVINLVHLYVKMEYPNIFSLNSSDMLHT